MNVSFQAFQYPHQIKSCCYLFLKYLICYLLDFVCLFKIITERRRLRNVNNAVLWRTLLSLITDPSSFTYTGMFVVQSDRLGVCYPHKNHLTLIKNLPNIVISWKPVWPRCPTEITRIISWSSFKWENQMQKSFCLFQCFSKDTGDLCFDAELQLKRNFIGCYFRLHSRCVCADKNNLAQSSDNLHTWWRVKVSCHCVISCM